MTDLDLEKCCLIFPFSRVNANAISVLTASLDVHPILKDLQVLFPPLKHLPTDLSDKLSEIDNVILAFSVFSTQLDLVSNLITKYKAILSSKNLLVVAGGPHPTGDPFSMLINGADVVCVGEGEVTLRHIILGFLSGNGFSSVKGVVYLKGNKLIKTSKPNPIDLSKFPPFSIKHDIIRPIEITRGCAWKCRFCQIRSKGGFPVRHRPIEQILKYVKHTVEYFSERRPDIRFISPNALSYGSLDGKTLRLEKVEKLLKGVRDIIGPSGKIYFGSFPSEVRPETITKESVDILKKYSNVSSIILGGQSGSNKVLQNVERGHDVKETERAVQLLIDANFEVKVDIIFGLPGEDEKAVRETKAHIKRLTKIGATIHSHTFLPLVGTPFASKAPGQIHPDYKELILNLQNDRKLKGHHIKQEKDASDLANRRKIELEMRRDYDTVKKK